MPRAGLNIVVEGSDGTGKTTAIQFVEDFYKNRSIPVSTCKNPGATPLGQEIRNLVKNRKDLNIDRYTEQVMMAADLCATIHDVIKPRVERGEVVISDRSNFISGMVYSLAGGVKYDQIDAFHSVALATNPPLMHVLLMYADFDVIKARRHHDNEGECKIEARGDQYHRAVVEQYKRLYDIGRWDYKQHPDLVMRLNRFVSFYTDSRGDGKPGFSIWPIDASQDFKSVEEQIRTSLSRLHSLAWLP